MSTTNLTTKNNDICYVQHNKAQDFDTNKEKRSLIKTLPPWGTSIDDLDKNLKDELVSRNNVSKCEKFCITKNGMILPPWGTSICDLKEGPWTNVTPGNISDCGGFFLTRNGRIFQSLQHANEWSKQKALDDFADLRSAYSDSKDESKVCHPRAGNALFFLQSHLFSQKKCSIFTIAMGKGFTFHSYGRSKRIQ